MSEILWEALKNIDGYIYPNEIEVSWSVLIALYPYITGLVAGAFIVASLERIFKVEEVRPTYRLALLTALAFLLGAPIPLVAHLGRPERAFEIMTTPHLTSAMAGFGFVYAWYLLVVLLTEIYFDYRKDIISWAREYGGIRGLIYKILTLGEWDDSEESLKADQRVVNIVTVIGLPSAALLHGYVGFIFGSVKANIWWSSPLMPIIFLFSAMVSGIALVLLIYMASSYIRGVELDQACTDTLGGYLLYAYILDFGLEVMELVHIFYTQEEGFDAIVRLINEKIFLTFIVIQIIFGTLVPIFLLLIAKSRIFRFNVRKYLYIFATVLTLIGVFAMRWNVVIGGQVLSKTNMGYAYYTMPLFGPESASLAIAIWILPFIILAILVKLLPPWEAPYKWERTESE